MTFAGFCVLATIGSIIRWRLTEFFGIYKGTFIVNMIGSFCIGLINNLDNDAIIIIGIGLLGSLTTFSVFCANIDSFSKRNYRSSLAYVLLNVISGVIASTITPNSQWPSLQQCCADALQVELKLKTKLEFPTADQVEFVKPEINEDEFVAAQKEDVEEAKVTEA